MHARCLTVLIVASFISLTAPGCRSPYYADQGAAVGAVTGALAGAAIGDAHDNAAGGALLGTAVGALAGTAIGDVVDQDVARSRAIIEERLGRQMSGLVTFADVSAMTQAGLSDDVITTHIRANGVAQRPSVNDLIGLRNAGVSDAVIQALQQAPPGPPLAAGPPPSPVIVEEHHYIAPPFPPFGFYPHRHHHRHHHHPGLRWGFSFSN